MLWSNRVGIDLRLVAIGSNEARRGQGIPVCEEQGVGRGLVTGTASIARPNLLGGSPGGVVRRGCRYSDRLGGAHSHIDLLGRARGVVPSQQIALACRGRHGDGQRRPYDVPTVAGVCRLQKQGERRAGDEALVVWRRFNRVGVNGCGVRADDDPGQRSDTALCVVDGVRSLSTKTLCFVAIVDRIGCLRESGVGESTVLDIHGIQDWVVDRHVVAGIRDRYVETDSAAASI